MVKTGNTSESPKIVRAPNRKLIRCRRRNFIFWLTAGLSRTAFHDLDGNDFLIQGFESFRGRFSAPRPPAQRYRGPRLAGSVPAAPMPARAMSDGGPAGSQAPPINGDARLRRSGRLVYDPGTRPGRRRLTAPARWMSQRQARESAAGPGLFPLRGQTRPPLAWPRADPAPSPRQPSSRR